MKRLILLLIIGVALAGPVWGATTPTPTPSITPTPTPTPVPVIPLGSDKVDVNAYCSFGPSQTQYGYFTDDRTGANISVPTAWTLHITDINWTCLSEANIDIKWATAGTYIDSVRFPRTGQGKCRSWKNTIASPNAGDYPIIYFSGASTGFVYLNGYLK